MDAYTYVCRCTFVPSELKMAHIEPKEKHGYHKEDFAFVSLLKDCAKKKDVCKGSQLHSEILKTDLLEKNPYIGSTLISMYAKCGMLATAEKVFEELPFRNVFAWSSLISGYSQQGQNLKALNCFEKMKSEGVTPDVVTFTSIFKACGSICEIEKGKEIHEEIISKGFLEKDIMLGTALVDMYVKFGSLMKAREVLGELCVRNIVSWNALITGHSRQGQCHEALDCLARLLSEGILPDTITFICILKACARTGAIEKGKQIHILSSRGLLRKDIVLGTALVDMYAKCGVLSMARQVLEEIPVRDVVSWSTLITGYTQHGQGQEALNCFERMQSEGLSPDTVTLICILKACGNIRAVSIGEKIHEEIIASGMLGKEDVMLGTALVDMYAKCGALEKAQEVIEELPARDVVSWSVLITGYAQQGRCQEALNCFDRMRNEGLCPDAVTFVCILKACSITGAINIGEQIHNEILRKGFLQKDVMVGNALVDMYAKSGLLSKAREVLEQLPCRDAVSWNSLIAGYAQQRQGHEALVCFEQMQEDGLSPDEVTFLCVLSSCSHSGLLDKTQMLFKNMTRKYGIIPNVDHHNCMVVAFGHAGDFDNAISVIKALPSSDCPEVWLALLGACKKWGNVKLGKLAFDQAVQQDHSYSAAYTLMANIFEAAGMQEDAKKVEAMRLQYAVGMK